MKKNKFNRNYTKIPIKAEDSGTDTLTVPNQSMSIRDILFRNTQGMAYDNYKTPYYEEQATFSSIPLNVIQDMEPSEKMNYLQEVTEKANTLKLKIKAEEEAKILKQQQSIQDAKVEETKNDES
jgi:hypothetical protein